MKPGGRDLIACPGSPEMCLYNIYYTERYVGYLIRIVGYFTAPPARWNGRHTADAPDVYASILAIRFSQVRWSMYLGTA